MLGLISSIFIGHRRGRYFSPQKKNIYSPPPTINNNRTEQSQQRKFKGNERTMTPKQIQGRVRTRHSIYNLHKTPLCKITITITKHSNKI